MSETDLSGYLSPFSSATPAKARCRYLTRENVSEEWVIICERRCFDLFNFLPECKTLHSVHHFLKSGGVEQI